MATDFLISFDDLKPGAKALKKLVQAFTRAGAPVASTDIDPRTKRTSGVNYRQVLISFTDSQTVALGVKTTGDIFEVRVNGAVLPLKNQDDQVKAVGEIARALDAGRTKFQAKMARTKVALPKGIATAAPRMEQQLQEASAKLDADIAAAKARIVELRAELGEPVMDSLSVLDDVIGEGNFATSWLGFKVVDHQSVIDKSATALPSASQLSADVDVLLRTAEADEMVLRGRVVRVSFSAPKVNYDVAVPIALDAAGGLRLYAVLPGIDSDLVRPSTATEDAPNTYAGEIVAAQAQIMDSVPTAAGETFDGGEWDTLVWMKQHGKVEDGDVPSKASRDSLVERGFVERGDGMNWLTDKGKGVAAVLDSAVLDAAKPTDLEEVFIRGDKGAFYISRADKIKDARFIPVRDKSGKKIKGREVHADNLHPTQEKADAASARIKKGWNLDAVDVPLATFERPEVVEAQAIAARLTAGDTLGDADFSHALATLKIALDTVETNHPINLAEGDIAQADLEEKAAESFRAAIQMLEAKAPLAA